MAELTFWDLFLNQIEKNFGKKLSPTQRQSIMNVINYFQDNYSGYNYQYLLYILANNKWETMHRWIPVVEKRASRIKQPLVFAWQERYWYTGFMGRGKTQITWIDNYRKFTPICQLKLGDPTIDLVKNPEKAMDDMISTIIMVEGMMQGLFRRNSNKQPLKLTDFMDKKNSLNTDAARAVVNTIDGKYITQIFNGLKACYEITSKYKTI